MSIVSVLLSYTTVFGATVGGGELKPALRLSSPPIKPTTRIGLHLDISAKGVVGEIGERTSLDTALAEDQPTLFECSLAISVLICKGLRTGLFFFGLVSGWVPMFRKARTKVL